MKEIIESIWEGDYETFQSLLSATPEYAFMKDENGRTLLSWASQVGDLRIIRLLLEKGSDVNCADDNTMETPLDNAIIADKLEAALFLIANGVDFSLKDIYGQATMHTLANKKANGLWVDDWELVVVKLLDHGAKFDSVPIAAAFGTIQDVANLVNAGHDVDEFLEGSDRTALQIAAYCNNVEMVKYLVTRTGNINWTDFNQMTAVDIATDSEIEALLSDHGGESFNEIMEFIRQGEQSVRAIQDFVCLVNSEKTPSLTSVAANQMDENRSTERIS